MRSIAVDDARTAADHPAPPALLVTLVGYGFGVCFGACGILIGGHGGVLFPLSACALLVWGLIRAAQVVSCRRANQTLLKGFVCTLLLLAIPVGMIAAVIVGFIVANRSIVC